MAKYKMSSFINIASLSVAMVSSIFILLNVMKEFNYDRFQKDYDRIYRVAINVTANGSTFSCATNGAPVVPALKEKYSEVEDAARIFRMGKNSVVQIENNMFYENGIIYVDGYFFDLFSVNFIKGEPSKALINPYTIVITEAIAEKYFKKDNPIGKLLSINNKMFEITGVVQNCPGSTHFKYDFITSSENYPYIKSEVKWTIFNCYSYIRLSANADVDVFSKKIRNLYDEYRGASSRGYKYEYFLQPISKIHLNSNLQNEREPMGDIQSINIFMGVGFLILLLGCMNFINLTTAQSGDRTKEVGIRKVAGANKYQIINQFLGESFLISLFGLLSALIIILLFLPKMNELAGTNINYSEIFRFSTLSIFVGLVVVTGLAAGFVPSAILSRFSPVKVLRGYSSGRVNKNSLRKALIVFQFVISNFLVIGTVVMFQQLDFMKNRELGINKEQKLILPAGSAFNHDNYEAIKSEFARYASISSVSVSSGAIGENINWYGVTQADNPEGGMIRFNHESVDFDYLPAYNVQIIKGRSFDRLVTSDHLQSAIINEAAVKALGYKSSDEAIGKKITYDNQDNIRTIIGVVKDFHYATLHEAIKPFLFDIVTPKYQKINFINITVTASNLKETIQFIKDKWSGLNPGKPFTYYFLDEQFDNLYKKDERMGALCGVFTSVALIVAYFGLIGLISFTARKRMKEISVRKVLGATIQQLVFVLSKETAKSVLLAGIIAWPIAYLVMNNWLEDFPYRISIGVGTLVIPAAAIFTIAFLSISSRCIRTAKSNPVDSLRNE